MSEEISREEIKTYQIKHRFYCDRCGKFLGESVECDDGYYLEFGKILDYTFYDEHSRNHYRLAPRRLCPDCYLKYRVFILDRLKEIGFEKVKEDE